MAEVSGYAIQWNQPAIIAGLFEERFARGAFNQSLIDNPDIAALWAHDTSRPLARVANKSLTLRSDNIGLWYSFTPDEKSPLGQEVLASVGSGLVNEVSVGFSSIEEGGTIAAACPSGSSLGLGSASSASFCGALTESPRAHRSPADRRAPLAPRRR